MSAKIKIICGTVFDGSQFGYQIRAPHHFTSSTGFKEKTDEDFEACLKLYDKVSELIYEGWRQTEVTLFDGEGVHLQIDIDTGEIDFDGLPQLVKKEIESQLTPR